MRSMFLGLGLTLLATLPLAQAQTVCLGMNCGTSDSDIENMSSAYTTIARINSLAQMDQFEANFGPLGSGRQKCYAECFGTFLSQATDCEEAANDFELDPDDDRVIFPEQRIDALNACLSVAETERSSCLSPVELAQCNKRHPDY